MNAEEYFKTHVAYRTPEAPGVKGLTRCRWNGCTNPANGGVYLSDAQGMFGICKQHRAEFEAACPDVTVGTPLYGDDNTTTTDDGATAAVEMPTPDQIAALRAAARQFEASFGGWDQPRQIAPRDADALPSRDYVTRPLITASAAAINKDRAALPFIRADRALVIDDEGHSPDALLPLLADLDATNLCECDGFTRVVSTLFTVLGIPHRVMRGSVVGSGDLGGVGWHVWIDLPDGRIVDYRCRMWLGEYADVPHGLFDPADYPRVRYQGAPDGIRSRWIVGPAIWRALIDRDLSAVVSAGLVLLENAERSAPPTPTSSALDMD